MIGGTRAAVTAGASLNDEARRIGRANVRPPRAYASFTVTPEVPAVKDAFATEWSSRLRVVLNLATSPLAKSSESPKEPIAKREKWCP